MTTVRTVFGFLIKYHSRKIGWNHTMGKKRIWKRKMEKKCVEIVQKKENSLKNFHLHLSNKRQDFCTSEYTFLLS